MQHPHRHLRREVLTTLAAAALAVAGLTAYSADSAEAATARQVEKLDRGVVSVHTGSGNLVSWRWLGVPPHQRHDFRAWTDALVAPDPERPDSAKAAVANILAFFTQLIADKRTAPADDLLSALIAVRDQGDGLSEDELMSLSFLILFAGYENTVNLIGNAVLALLENPAQRAALRADPGLAAGAVDELARFDGPAPIAIRRFPVEDVSVGGTTIPAGETVLLSLAAANRDPDRFAEPDRLDLGRDASGHLALGHGIHYCLGAPLARMETEIALTALLDRFPRLALDVPSNELRRRPSMRTRGLLALPVRY